MSSFIKNVTSNLKRFVGKRTLMVITIIVMTTTLGFVFFHKSEPLVKFRFPIEDLPTRKLLVKTIQSQQSKIKTVPTRAVVIRKVATDSFMNLADCQIYSIVLYEIPGWFCIASHGIVV